MSDLFQIYFLKKRRIAPIRIASCNHMKLTPAICSNMAQIVDCMKQYRIERKRIFT